MRNRAAGLEQVRVTLSMAVAQRQDEAEPAAVIKRAEQALYRAKNAGRNCVISASQRRHHRLNPEQHVKPAQKP